RGLRLLGAGADRDSEIRIELDLGRQRPDELGAGMRQDLADLREPELDLAALDRGGGCGVDELDLRLELIRKAELHQELLEIEAGRALPDIADRLGIAQRLPEGLDG